MSLPAHQEAFWYFIRERESIRKKKEAGLPKPWTDDPVLQQYRFCNVFRELDTTTVWIRENWREPYSDHPKLWFAMCVARMFNLIPTLAAIGFPSPWDPKVLDIRLKARKKVGLKIFTSAYMLPGRFGEDKAEGILHRILTPLHQEPPPFAAYDGKGYTLRAAWEELYNRDGFGGFLAYEVITDLRHTRYLRNAPDIMTWANAGPGAIRGLNRYRGFVPGVPLGQYKANELMRELLEMSKEQLPKDFPPLEMRDIEHCLCEYDKMYRAVNKDGKPKQRYDGVGDATDLRA